MPARTRQHLAGNEALRDRLLRGPAVFASRTEREIAQQVGTPAKWATRQQTAGRDVLPATSKSRQWRATGAADEALPRAGAVRFEGAIEHGQDAVFHSPHQRVQAGQRDDKLN